MIFRRGFELPAFAAIVLVDDRRGAEALRDYYVEHVQVAQSVGVGLILESPTWRGGAGWGAALGLGRERLHELNSRAVSLVADAGRQHWRSDGAELVISACVGPRSDAYRPQATMRPDEAEEYHFDQLRVLADTEAHMAHAMTLTYPAEAIGIAKAAKRVGLPAAISFTVETDGRLPDGNRIADAIEQVDDATDAYPLYYGINCAHPEHFSDELPTGDVASRLRVVRPNASPKSHAELDESTELDAGNPVELAEQLAQLAQRQPSLTIFGGCCGTDARHVRAIAQACL